MDRHTWMYKISRATSEYVNGVKDFITCAMKDMEKKHKEEGKEEMILCPCRDCNNFKKYRSVDIVRDHLFRRGFKEGYLKWIWHGEGVHSSKITGIKRGREEDNLTNNNEDDVIVDRLEEMIQDMEDHFMHQPDIFNSLVDDSNKLLYPGCKDQFTRLSTTLKLCKLKAKHNWSDKSFTEILQLFGDILPTSNVLPTSTYQAKKILCPMGMNVKKIHACPNDCVLFRNEHEDLDMCPKCGASRYKRVINNSGTEDRKRPPAKVMWYLPIVQRFRRLFVNGKDAKLLRWHADERKSDGMLRHPADSPQWRTIDGKFPEFGEEPRNLRLGFCADGMNPYRTMSSNHSTWPVLLTVYNLPPWLCMKRKYIMLTLLISGPKEAGNNIDIYLQPLIEDLKLLWDKGVMVYDAYSQSDFTLRAMIFCTISDFPAYGNLSGYTIKGAKACPICEEGTIDRRLNNCRKNVYLGHRTFLPSNHSYKKNKKSFDGTIESRVAPLPLSGKQVFERVKDIDVVLGKLYKKPIQSKIWKKRSIFWDLPYWEHLQVRHCLDFMHIEKNVCESIIGTLLNIPGKTKDGIKARLDMEEMGIRTELAPQITGKRSYLPPACYTLSRKEKISFCDCLSGVKVPSGYSSNIRGFVSMKDLKLVGLKSHDCHVLMQQLLPIAIRGILPKHVRLVITKLCYFFNAIYSKVIDPMMLDKLQADIIVTLCEFEMYFLHSLFDIMMHLVIHMVREIKLCGPLYLRQMYPFERFLCTLKAYVRNRCRPEGSIIEGYSVEETIEFCTLQGEWRAKISDGSWTPCGHDDVLSRALGNKEHGGRVRGVGGRAKIKNVFGSQKSKQSGVVSMDELYMIKKEITEKVRGECQEMMNAQLQGIFDHLKQMGLPLPNDNFGREEIGTPPIELVRSSCHSVDRPQNFFDLEVPTLCRLCVIYPDKGKVIAARGQVFPLSSDGGNVIHGRLIDPNNVKVSIDEVIVEFQLNSLPVPCEEHETIGSATGSFVEWPKDLVILGQEPEKKRVHKKAPQKPNKIVSKESATPALKNEAFLDDGKNLSDKCRALRFLVDNMPRESATKTAVKNTEVFKFHQSVEVPIYVTREDVEEFLRLSCLNIPVLQIFMMYIYNLCTDLKDDSFAFRCPSILALARDSKNLDDTSRYMCEVMKDAKQKHFILAPYIQSKHCMLLMYCVDESAVYVFDPLKQKRDINVKLPWETAYKVYVKYGGKKNNQNNLLWYHEAVQCPQQKGGTDCGYFVMWYMYDVVMLAHKDSKKWKEVLGTQRYTKQQITEIRDLWAEFFTQEYM